MRKLVSRKNGMYGKMVCTGKCFTFPRHDYENADCEKHKSSVDNQNDLPMNVSIKYIMIHDFRVVHQEKGIN
jgi:hypothetical protein